MHTWDDLVEYVDGKYKVKERWENGLSLVFRFKSSRRQEIFLWRKSLKHGSGADHWVQIESPVGTVGSLDLHDTLERIGDMICGGLTIQHGMAILRHTIRMDNLDTAGFERGMKLVLDSADSLEDELTGSDVF